MKLSEIIEVMTTTAIPRSSEGEIRERMARFGLSRGRMLSLRHGSIEPTWKDCVLVWRCLAYDTQVPITPPPNPADMTASPEDLVPFAHWIRETKMVERDPCATMQAIAEALLEARKEWLDRRVAALASNTKKINAMLRSGDSWAWKDGCEPEFLHNWSKYQEVLQGAVK
jgi:hypothetical protein